MDRFEYAIGLISIIVGLGLADLAMSLHRLLKQRERVRWDWVALATAGFAGFSLIRMWYQLWTVRDFPEVTHLFFLIRSEEHTSELQSLMRISYAVFCLKKKTTTLKCIHTYKSQNMMNPE